MAKKKSSLDAIEQSIDYSEASKKAMQHLSNDSSTQEQVNSSTQEQKDTKTTKQFKAIRIDVRLHKHVRRYAFETESTMAAYCENLITKDLLKKGVISKERAKELLS